MNRRTAERPRAAKRSLTVVTALAVIVAIGLGAERYRFYRLRPLEIPGSVGLQIWAHHAYQTAATEKEILEPLFSAVAKGYPGVEIDLQFVEGQGIFLSHDPIPESGPGNRIPVREYLVQYGSALYYWLDFKNLYPTNAGAAAAALADAVRGLGVSDHCFVESRWPMALAAVKRVLPDIGVVEIVHPHPLLRPLAWLVLPTWDIHAISMDDLWVDDDAARAYGHVALFTYTVNDPAELARLAGLGVRVVLTDRLPPRQNVASRNP